VSARGGDECCGGDTEEDVRWGLGQRGEGGGLGVGR
jgi:hypothetical protein